MRRALTLILGVALFGILAAVVVASQGGDDPASTETVTDTVERTATVEDNPRRERADDDAQNGVDISGPCDEAEHASDPRCAGQPPAQNRAPAQGGVDISGPCDEAEHANDPRCTGAPTGRVDNSGPGSVNSGRDDDDADDDHGGEDRSGHGGDGDRGGDDDRSGHGGGDEDRGGDDDRSGHGRGGDDD
jgi:hypothetical protein